MITPKHPRLLILSLGAVLLLAGCKKQNAAAPEAPPLAKAPPAAPVPSAPTVPAPPTAAPAPPPAQTQDAANAAAYAGYIAEMEQTLNDFLGEYIRKNKRTPKDIGEMMSLGIITSIPPAPTGKKWVIDQRTGKISAR